MLTLNGKLFTNGKRAVVDTLFHPGGTAAGWYKRNANGVLLYNLRGERIGGINRHGVLYRSTKIDGGRYWHQAAEPNEVGQYASYRQKVEEAHAAVGMTY